MILILPVFAHLQASDEVSICMWKHPRRDDNDDDDDEERQKEGKCVDIYDKFMMMQFSIEIVVLQANFLPPARRFFFGLESRVSCVLGNGGSFMFKEILNYSFSSDIMAYTHFVTGFKLGGIKLL
jgi:hypothetical protein